VVVSVPLTSHSGGPLPSAIASAEAIATPWMLSAEIAAGLHSVARAAVDAARHATKTATKNPSLRAQRSNLEPHAIVSSKWPWIASSLRFSQ
jgi:hypothetical protein